MLVPFKEKEGADARLRGNANGACGSRDGVDIVKENEDVEPKEKRSRTLMTTAQREWVISAALAESQGRRVVLPKKWFAQCKRLGIEAGILTEATKEETLRTFLRFTWKA